MAIHFEIKQNERLKTLDAKFLQDYCKSIEYLLYQEDIEFYMEPYRGVDEDIRNRYFSLIGPKKIGCGFRLMVDDYYHIHLYLMIPSTYSDINLCFDFINDFCTKFEFNDISMDNEVFLLSEIASVKAYVMDLMKNNLLNILKEDNLVYGALLPIYVEQSFVKDLEAYDLEHRFIMFMNYMHAKQTAGFYFASPKVYQEETNELVAYYTLYLGHTAIVSKQPHLPKWLVSDQKIDEWKVEFAITNYDYTYKPVKTLSYQEFVSMFDISKKPHFDQEYHLFSFGKKELTKLMKDEILLYGEEIKRQLKLNKVVFLDAFSLDMDLFYVYRYKPSLFAKGEMIVYYNGKCYFDHSTYHLDNLEEDSKAMLERMLKKELNH